MGNTDFEQNMILKTEQVKKVFLIEKLAIK